MRYPTDILWISHRYLLYYFNSIEKTNLLCGNIEIHFSFSVSLAKSKGQDTHFVGQNALLLVGHPLNNVVNLRRHYPHYINRK